eukprot:1927599-Prorocentrum_lima.AAC.1
MQQLAISEQTVEKERLRADQMQAQRLEFSPGFASNGSPPPPVQETHGPVIHAQSLMVGPPTQRMNNP